MIKDEKNIRERYDYYCEKASNNEAYELGYDRILISIIRELQWILGIE